MDRVEGRGQTAGVASHPSGGHTYVHTTGGVTAGTAWPHGVAGGVGTFFAARTRSTLQAGAGRNSCAAGVDCGRRQARRQTGRQAGRQGSATGPLLVTFAAAAPAWHKRLLLCLPCCDDANTSPTGIQQSPPSPY